MPTRAPKACPRPGCPHVQPCAAHSRKPWAHAQESRHARGYGRLLPVPCPRGNGVHTTWDTLRACVLERDARVCGYCQHPAPTVDHLTPKAQGGTNDEWNLVACCWPCQKSKAGREGNGGRARVTA
jgi:5-methylcytosine-specific restriction protein A